MLLPNIIEGEDKRSPFLNCLRNQYRHIKKWAKRTCTDCFRIYDKEISKYPIAIDIYAGRFCVHYFSPLKEVDEPPKEFIDEINNALSSLFGTEIDQIYWRTRMRRKRTRQYEKVNNAREFFNVVEFGVAFKINLTDYLDTGLFLDHRETRKLVAEASQGKRLLNLFAYTCAFSVHAAAAGAAFTKSIDMSNVYTAWGRDNFNLNGLPERSNVILRADCLKFLLDEVNSRSKYDIIVIDPPTISRSKKMTQLFDLQKDYIFLINQALKLLLPNGIIFFSTNSRKFSFDMAHFESASIQEISQKTQPIDFKDKIHRCWKIRTKK